MVPSTSFTAASVRSFIESFSSSSPSTSSRLISLKISVSATVNVEFISQSVTSASTVNPSGIFTSSAISEDISRLSFIPGIPKPTTTFLLPSEITLPLSTVTLEKLSVERIIPVTITKGE